MSTNDETASIETGCLILVVGPSGVGKDTLMRAAKKLLKHEPGIAFPHRLITRESDPEHEDHGTISMADYDALCGSGDAPIHWRAHGHGYVIPRSVLDAVNSGKCCVVNGSRGILDQARAVFPRTHAILIELDRTQLETRIAQRGREAGDEAKKRLNREQQDVSDVPGVHRLLNNSTVEAGAQRLADLIRACARWELAQL